MQPTVETNYSPQKPYFAALTGFRAIAAYLVFFYHFNPFHAGGRAQLAHDFVSGFHIGVSLFFVLSGFLITLRYHNRVAFTWSWWGTYMRNRVARIYPMYLLLTLLTFFAFSLDSRFDPVGWWHNYSKIDKLIVVVTNLTFLRGFFDDLKFTGVSQGWSLTVEETFYILAPFLIYGVAKRPKRLLAYLPLLLGFGVLMVLIFSPWAPLGFFGSIRFNFNFTFFGRCTEFLGGMALALLVVCQKNLQPSAASYCTWLGVSGIAAFLYISTLFTIDYEHQLSAVDLLIVVSCTLLLLLSICSLYYGLLRERSWLRVALESKSADILGKSSFAFYLIHVGIFSTALDIYLTHNLILKFILLNLLAIGLYKFVEKPIHLRLAKGN
ncbi:acyltransferase family protein [Hymenobacter metallilatus]|uniref:Acyltransferase n=1 Tax=Hymenobacter metallilatus TaxID=2493666 RepID=A0A3R9NZ59_9BACT|nr:acyltransferase [Hymenobacter metallilatus]RSK24361.1 acyltransferase [Hymenobacter metallilatus]